MTKRKIVSDVIVKEELISTMAIAMDDKKAQDIVLMDLTNVAGASFDYFMICNADSSTQVNAIAENVEDEMRTKCQQKPWHSEGYTNAEWILLDYGSIVAHVFRTEVREHYQLENLWADAEITRLDEKEIEKYHKKKDDEHGKSTRTTKSTKSIGATKPTKSSATTKSSTKSTRTAGSKTTKSAKTGRSKN